MPTIWASGNPVGEEGLHFDESPSTSTIWGGYDYRADGNTQYGDPVWVRGEAAGDQFFPTRMVYWPLDNSCSENVRVERYEDIGGVWQWYEVWQDTFHIVHVQSL
jgi:hypothetical protein